MNTDANQQVSINDLIGARVRGADGKRLGRIDDLTLSHPDGFIDYATVMIDGEAGTAPMSVRVPWSQFHLTGNHDLVLEISAGVLRSVAHPL